VLSRKLHHRDTETQLDALGRVSVSLW
jgi:hypothetical protein